MSAPVQTGPVTVVWVDYVGSDWLAIYLGEDKVYEGHPPQPTESLDVVGVKAEDRVLPSERLTDHRRMRGMPSRLSAARS